METGGFDMSSGEKCHKNFDHFNYSLHMNKKNILGEYSLFFKPNTWHYLLLDWTNLYWNNLVVAYWRWLLTRIIPQGQGLFWEEVWAHPDFLEDNQSIAYNF